ncbi:MAG: tyrosine-protein phosphatase [Desulfobacterales bacterium]|nr:MAG: tyrosine-protein phosphatase [Desulfobacterales bacterium]
MTNPRQTPTISSVTVDRRQDGTHKICWKTRRTELEIKIFAGDSPETIARTSPVAVVKDVNCAEIPGLDPQVRYYFDVVPGDGPGTISASRRVPLEGVANFRDLGGYETSKGRRVRWGQVFRSGHLAKLTAQDKLLLRRMGIQLVCDFRTPEEIKAQPDWLPDDGALQYLHLPIVHGELDPAVAMERMQKGDISWLTEDFMVKRYIEKIDRFPHVWGQIFERLADPQSRPLVFHCTAGKDRAGACAALILLALDVPAATVIHDHGLSNVYNAHVLKMINTRVRAMGIDPAEVRAYFTAPRGAIAALVDHITATYGSAAAYLQTKAGLGPEKIALLKQQLLD